MAHLEYPRDCFEVIVVDDGNEISPESIIAPFHKQINLTLLKQINAGLAVVSNTGVKNVKGDILAFIDDDCEPHPGWLRALAAQFAKIPDCMMGGRIINKLRNNYFSSASKLIVDIVYRQYNAKLEQARFFASNNIAIPILRKLTNNIHRLLSASSAVYNPLSAVEKVEG